MTEQRERIEKALRECAEMRVPDTMDPWPAIRERALVRSHRPRRTPLLPNTRVGWAFVALLLVAVGVVGSPLAIGAVDRIPFLASRFPPPSDVPAGVEPVPTGQEFVIASGSVDGVKWTYSVYETDRGLCTSLNTRNSSGGSCGIDLSRPLGVSTSTFTQKGLTFVDGVAKENVERVELVLEDGRVLKVPTESAPAELDRDLRFFVISVPEGTSVDEVVAKNARGEVVDRQRI